MKPTDPMNNNSSHESRDIKQEFMQTEQIVDFADQNALSEVARNETPVTVPRSLVCMRESRDHTIYDFLRRPRMVEVLLWNNSNLPGTDLGAWTCPDVLFQTEMNVCKVRDFRYFKCDVVFQFKINASVAAVGRLIAWTYPQPSVIGTGSFNRDSLCSLTGFQHAFIDAGSSNALKFTVPFVFRKGAYDFLVDKGTPGNPWAMVVLSVFNSFVTATGSTATNISVWVHAENIELGVPTQQDTGVYPAPTFDKVGGKYRVKPNFKAQMNGAPRSEASANSHSGTISDMVKTIGSGAGAVADLGLGPISEIGNAVEWVADIASNGLRAFGYSKPGNAQTIMPMVQQPMKNYTHTVGDDSSVVLGADPRNCLDINAKLFVTEHDEMDINWVISKPMFIEKFTWDKTHVTGDVLASWPVTPGFSHGVTPTSQVSTTMLGYVSHLFELWRGSINYRLAFVANSFYQGSVGLAFLPGVFTVPSVISLADIEAAPKVVCQITSSTECSFTAPYNLATPFMKVKIASRTSVGTDFTYADLLDPEVSAGLMVVYVINMLTAPALAPNQIDINLFIAGGPDMTFAIPSCPTYVPVAAEAPVPDVPQEKRTAPKTKFVAQMNQIPRNLNLKAGDLPSDSHALLKTSEPPKNIKFHQMSMGDAQISLRALTRMFSVVDEDTIPLNNALTLDPSYYGWDLVDYTNCRLYRIARLYAYWRGSIRYKFIPDVPPGTTYPLFVVSTYRKELSPPDTPSFDPALPAHANIGFNWTVNVAQTPVVEVAMPFYKNRYVEMTSNINTTARNKLQVFTTMASACPYTLLSAAGDDHSFGYLVAPPNLTLL